MKKSGYPTGILHYIPFLYVIWADDLLSPSEISVVKRALEEDLISQKERDQIETWLNTDKPPSSETIKEWKSLIDNSNVKLVESDAYPLTSFSQKLAGSGNGVEVNPQLKSIEVN